ncbi:MAG: amino acid ABC transporter permease [Treponema sp.]|nr:amino acid ABC transporter permease [Treponema sp.]
MGQMLLVMLEGTIVSLKVFFLTLLFSLPLGLIICAGRMSKITIIRLPVHFFMLIIRGTPLMLQLFFVYFAPYHISKRINPDFTVHIDRFIAVIVAFSINYAAYFAEIYRGGIASIPQGQYEAAKMLGFTKIQTFFIIILPQVIKRILPATANEVITLVKDTSLAQVIGVAELFRVAYTQANTQVTIMPIFVAGVFYFVMNWVVNEVFLKFEKRLSYYK